MLLIGLVFSHVSDGSAGRKSRSGRWTATDLQLFNPNPQTSSASAEWITDAGVLYAALGVTVPLSSTRYYTIEASGLVPATFIGGMELVSPTQELYGIVTHFDKGNGASAFERGNDHYELRDSAENSVELEAPLVVKTAGSLLPLTAAQHTNISILNPYSNGTISVTIQLYTPGGTLVGSVNQSISGNKLLEFDALFGFGAASVFTGWARIISDKPIGAYISIYDGTVQGGYSAMPKLSAGAAARQSTQSTQVLNLLGLFPNSRPTNDALAVRTLYIVNNSASAVNVLVGSIPLLGDLLNIVLGPQTQQLLLLPSLSLLDRIFVTSSEPVNSVLMIRDVNNLLLDPANVRGLVVYPMQTLAEVLPLQVTAIPVDPQTYCAVAPTIYTGYQSWNSTIKVINPVLPNGVITATFFPALGLSSVTNTVVLTKSLPYSTSVSIDFSTSGLPGTTQGGAVYLEANAPFLGDVTSLRPSETDGMMSYRTEPISCLLGTSVEATPTPSPTPPGGSTATPTPTPTLTPTPSGTRNPEEGPTPEFSSYIPVVQQ